MGKAIHLELRYPNLALTEYTVTSPKSQEYNCFAWVAGDRERWWQPIPKDEFYWIQDVPIEETLSAYIQAYKTLSYAPCDSTVLETGYEKIALYVNDEVLVQVQVVGLCQSDIKKILYPLYEPPRIFGHEMAGTIAKIGENVTNWQVGQRVVVMHHIPCMRCQYCLNDNFSMCEIYKNISTTAGFNASGGGFAEYVKVPGHIVRNGGLIPIPDRISFEQASFVEPTNCCLKAVKKARIAPGESVLVTGAGPIGLMFIMLIKYFGGRAISTDLIPSRLEKALSVGAEAAFDARDSELPANILALTGGMGVDTTLLAVPSDKAFFQALDCTRRGGKILFFAEFPDQLEIPINPNILYRREIDLMGSYSSSYRLQSLAVDIVFNQRIDVNTLISDRFSLQELPAAVNRATSPHPDTLKILIYP